MFCGLGKKPPKGDVFDPEDEPVEQPSTPTTGSGAGTATMSDSPSKSTLTNALQLRSMYDVVSTGTIGIYAATWNMHGLPVPESEMVRQFLYPTHNDEAGKIPTGFPSQDVYVIGSEECAQSIEKSLLSSSKKNWEDVLQRELGEKYVQLAGHTLNAIHIVVFVRKELLPMVSAVHTAQVVTGVGNVVGNKGAVAVSFKLGATKLVFVTCHLAAHQDKALTRNAECWRINQEMALGRKVPVLNPAPQTVTSAAGDAVGSSQSLGAANSADSLPSGSNSDIMRQPGGLWDTFDQIYWMGDLNYRINGNRSVIDVVIERGMYEVLLANDQLLAERSKGLVFPDFLEGPLTFPPTFKYDLNSDQFDTSGKTRIPAWTDRILFRQNVCVRQDVQDASVQLVAYSSCQDIKYSDHRPVYAVFQSPFHLDASTLVSLVAMSPTTKKRKKRGPVAARAGWAVARQLSRGLLHGKADAEDMTQQALELVAGYDYDSDIRCLDAAKTIDQQGSKSQ